MSVVSHYSSSWHRLRERVTMDDVAWDDFATVVVVCLTAIAIAVAWFVPLR
jgi:hypothetical protein